MENEQYYLFVDKTGHCFEDFQDEDDGSGYNDVIGAWMRGGRKFTVGDMLAFRDDLTNAGFKWGIDFFVKKVDKDEICGRMIIWEYRLKDVINVMR